jgi:hypothetical protein
MRLQDIDHILECASDLETIEWIYFEGGEPFLYYMTLLQGVKKAYAMGYKVGIVTNVYWAKDSRDAREYLEPFAGLISDLSISNDLYHWDEEINIQVEASKEAAEWHGIPLGVISIAEPECQESAESSGQLPAGVSGLMCRGRAAAKLSARVEPKSWERFDNCPHENLADPGRVHIDPLGYLHVCQGITIGNIFRNEFNQILGQFDPRSHPILTPLIKGGPYALVKEYDLEHQSTYADACHLCYESRVKLRAQYPKILGPDQMYGVFNQ